MQCRWVLVALIALVTLVHGVTEAQSIDRDTYVKLLSLLHEIELQTRETAVKVEDILRRIEELNDQLVTNERDIDKRITRISSRVDGNEAFRWKIAGGAVMLAGLFGVGGPVLVSWLQKRANGS